MRLGSKVILFLVVAIVIVFQQTVPIYATGNLMMEIRPSRFEVLVEPGRRGFYNLEFKNNSDEVVHFTATARDWDLDQDQKVVLLEPDSLDESASTWFRFNPKDFAVQPRDEQILRFAIAPPPNAQPGEYRTCLVLTTDSTMTMKDGMTYKPTFLVMVYVNVPDIQRTGRLDQVKVIKDEDANYHLQGEFHATGNAHLRLAGRYTVTDALGIEVQAEKLGTKVVLPGRSDRFQALLGKDLKPGEYQVKLEWFYIPAHYMKGQFTEYPEGEKGFLEEFKFVIE